MRRGLASALSKNVVTPLGKGIVPTRVLKLPKKVVGGGCSHHKNGLKYVRRRRVLLSTIGEFSVAVFGVSEPLYK